MALAHFLGAALPLLLLCAVAEASELGVSYGMVANNLPGPASVVNLLKQNSITMVRIYDANPNVLNALANTGIKVMVMVPNENVADMASNAYNALQWVKNNVAAYPATHIHAVAVGNEVFRSRPDLNSKIVPAMANVQAALAQLNLADAVKVTTPVAFDTIDVSWPPSAGRFREDLAQPVMKPMLDFLQRTGSYLSVNYYPYLTYMSQPNTFNLDYVLANPNAPGVVDPDKKQFTYYNFLDAQRDATYYVMDRLGFPSLAVKHTEHGAPSGGRLHPGHGGRRLLQDGGVASVANAQTYINNLMNRVLVGNTGTPLRPNADMDVYIFALFNENQKGASRVRRSYRRYAEEENGSDDVEQHFGLFYPNMQRVYEFNFTGVVTPPGSLANAAVGADRLQAALDFACGHGADCSAIQPGTTCFQPDTKAAHASYAFNSYYQRKGRASGTCDFAGAAYIVYQEPAGYCDATSSWCVANAGVGADRLQAALDYACGHGADCSDIQPGAACFEPNTKAAHASHAFNSYYQRNGRGSGTCDFAGAASIVYQAPKFGNCVLLATARA